MNKDKPCEMRQPFSIKRIIEELKLEEVDTQKRPTPVAKPLLHKDLKGRPRFKVGIIDLQLEC